MKKKQQKRRMRYRKQTAAAEKKKKRKKARSHTHTHGEMKNDPKNLTGAKKKHEEAGKDSKRRRARAK